MTLSRTWGYDTLSDLGIWHRSGGPGDMDSRRTTSRSSMGGRGEAGDPRRTPLPPGQAEEAVFAQSLDPRRAPAGGQGPRGPGPPPRTAGDPRRTPGAVAPPCGGPPGTTSSQRFFFSLALPGSRLTLSPPGRPGLAGGPPKDPPVQWRPLLGDPRELQLDKLATVFSLWLWRGPGSLSARQAALAWPGDPRLGRGTPGGPPADPHCSREQRSASLGPSPVSGAPAGGPRPGWCPAAPDHCLGRPGTPGGPPAAVAPPGGRAPGTAALRARHALSFALPGPRLTLSPPGRPGLAGGPPADPPAPWRRLVDARRELQPTNTLSLCSSAALLLCSSAPASQLWLFSWAARGTPGGPPALPAARGTPGGPPALPAARRTAPKGRLSESEAGLRL